MRNVILEGLGAFFFTLVLGLNVLIISNVSYAPFVVGACLMVLVYIAAPFSGGHFNPLVTIAFWIRGSISSYDVLPYISAQLFGASVAFFPVSFLVPHDSISVMNDSLSQIFAAEFIFSMLLVLVYLFVLTSKRVEGNSYFGLAIGMTMTIGMASVGSISGAVLNPASTFSLMVFNRVSESVLPAYLSAQILATLGAGFLARFLLADDED